MKPKAKTNILIEEMPDEILVYDLDRHRAHCLNETAAFLLREADGNRSVEELARAVGEAFGTTPSEETVRLGLERLVRARLVEWEDPAGPVAAGMDRRKAIRQLAALGLAIPAVMTITAPLAAQGATGISIGECALATVGRCCVNNKLCIQQKNGSFKCSEPGC